MASPTPNLTPDLQVVLVDSLATADLGGESVLLDPTSGSYFGLNEVGTRIVSLLGEPRTVREVQQTLLDEYDVDPGVLAADVSAFVSELMRRGLVKAHGEASSRSGVSAGGASAERS